MRSCLSAVALACFVAAQPAAAQQLMPLRTLPATRVELNPELKNLVANRDSLQRLQQRSRDTIRILQKDRQLESAGIKTKIDQLQTRIQTDSTKQKMVEAKIETEQALLTPAGLDTLNATPPVTVTGIGGISDIQKPATAGGNFAIVTTFRLGSYKRIEDGWLSGIIPGWIDPPFLYIGFNTRTHGSADTASVVRSFLFPDISKRDLVLGYFQTYHQHADGLGWSVAPTVEVSLNRFKSEADTTGAERSFGSISGLAGIRFSYTEEVDVGGAVPVGFFLYPYFSAITVQPKDTADYGAMLRGVGLPRTLYTPGAQVGLQLASVQLFANMRYVLNNTQEAGVKDLRGLTWTLGTILGVDVFRFRRFRV